jgi:hypothetical protein
LAETITYMALRAQMTLAATPVSITATAVQARTAP